MGYGRMGARPSRFTLLAKDQLARRLASGSGEGLFMPRSRATRACSVFPQVDVRGLRPLLTVGRPNLLPSAIALDSYTSKHAEPAGGAECAAGTALSFSAFPAELATL